MKCLKIINVSDAKQPPVDAVILDGAVAVQMMATGTARRFQGGRTLISCSNHSSSNS